MFSIKETRLLFLVDYIEKFIHKNGVNCIKKLVFGKILKWKHEMLLSIFLSLAIFCLIPITSIFYYLNFLIKLRGYLYFPFFAWSLLPQIFNKTQGLPFYFSIKNRKHFIHQFLNKKSGGFVTQPLQRMSILHS